MLTLKAVYKDGKVFFQDEVPFDGERRVLVTFLDDEIGDVFMTRDQIAWMVECVRSGRIRLSKRQRQVLSLAKSGMKDAEIAQELGISRSSVRNHLSRAYRTLGVRKRSEAIAKAVEFDLV